MLDTKQIEQKWIKRWRESRIFEANPDKRKKFFCTFPYPYINAYPHIGHLYTIMRVEAFARYKRHCGYNVLFPQGWHATGSPIISAANRVRQREEKQIKIMREMGFSDKEIKKFENPEHWVDFFAPEFKKDLTAMGLSIDWRRTFVTASLNSHYDAFIRWQFRKLKENGRVIKGKFPVVWDPAAKAPVGDHDRIEGEGEIPQEYLLVKHKLEEDSCSDGCTGAKWVVTATLRPDTILGVTNLYANPDTEVVEAVVNEEIWILSEKAARELQLQDKKVKIQKKLSVAADLIGKKVKEFAGHSVPILPGTFVDLKFGTGIVHSVPSDSADDLIALYDLQKDGAMCRKYGLNQKEIQAIKPIAVIEVPGYGEIPADDILKKLGVKNQNERGKLEKAKEILYRDAYYKGKLNKLYAKGFKKDYSGKSVEEAKDQIKQEIIDAGFGAIFYQLTGRVVARSLAECVVKIVDDQWFMAYGDENWKKQTRKAFRKIKLYPEKVRPQFEYVIGWLHNWACTREEGLGTRLPWDEKWLIESLSDSTIYMAYYTIAHILQEIDANKISDELFDLIFLDKGKLADIAEKTGIGTDTLKKMKLEFEYWYPLDFRNSGKDLVQNHLTFFVFNHTAIFPEKYWPRGIGVNGWVTIDGQKMSKSLGNMIPLRDMSGKFSVDSARLTILSGGEGLDDPNWESEFARSMKTKLNSLYDFCIRHYGKGREEREKIDEWMESELNRIIKKATDAMEQTLFRTASQAAYFELQHSLRWYLRRCLEPNKNLMKKIIESQLIMLAPFTPFICEETWEAIGNTEKFGFISNAKWPKFDAKKIKPELDITEKIMQNTLNDINQVLKLAKVDKPKSIQLFIAEPWKYELFQILRKTVEETRNPGEVMKRVMAGKLKKHGREISRIVPRVIKAIIPTIASQDEEYNAMSEVKGFLENEFGAGVEIVRAQESEEQKAKAALPGKAAILVE